MKNFYKIGAFIMFSMFFMIDANADEWADKDCKEYEELIGGLVWLSGETLDMSDKARKAEKKAEEKQKEAISKVSAKRRAELMKAKVNH